MARKITVRVLIYLLSIECGWGRRSIYLQLLPFLAGILLSLGFSHGGRFFPSGFAAVAFLGGIFFNSFLLISDTSN
jgi:hypothetical protein